MQTDLDKSNFPPVTMALLTYNSARTVAESLKSIQAQDYPNLEILVQDDVELAGDVLREAILLKTNRIRSRLQKGDPVASFFVGHSLVFRRGIAFAHSDCHARHNRATRIFDDTVDRAIERLRVNVAA